MSGTDPLHPPHDTVPLRPVQTDVVAEWPAGTYLENLALDADGRSWLVTSPLNRSVYRVSPDGATETVAEFDESVAGIVSDPQGALVAVGTAGQAWSLHRLAETRAETVCELPGVLGANGMTWADGRLLLADSMRGVLLTVHPDRGTSSVWLEHPLLTPLGPDSPLPGVNGLAVHDGWVLMSSTDRALLLQVPVTSSQPARDLEVLAERLVGDDLTVVPDGRVVVTTNTYHSVLCLYPDGHREDIAGHDQGVAGPTAVAVGPESTQTLYVTTTGGLLSPPGDAVESARLLRLDVSERRFDRAPDARDRISTRH